MSTNYKTFDPNTSTYKDLSDIFLSITLGTPSSITTNYKISNGNDLNMIFASINSSGGQDIGFDTGYDVSGTDLRYIFASINSKQLFNSTSGLIITSPDNYKTGTLANNFYLPTGYTYFNFAIYGGGGNGAQPDSSSPSSGYGTGGGGAGAYIKSIQIPYSNSGNTITNITYGISGGGQYRNNSYIVVNYNNSTLINLQAGQGYTTVLNQGTVGSEGGTTSISNTTSFYNSTNITQVNGSKGGNQGENGTTNGYTSSGSGNNGGASAPVGNPPTASNTYNTPDGESYIINSSGGGKSQVVSGYGAGGAATIANYNNNASAYRTGSVGCIVYWLS